MNCINCGAFLTDTDLDYCPHCGANVLIQKKVDYLSKLYYNQGLEKASIRDLSGAISCLKQSLAYDKRNIRARNLLGLVYFETGEVVAALSEWVISKNIQKNRNLASEYIAKLQANQNKLETINESIKKYNNALAMCREGHEDMAAIRLKKILAQNPKLIKGYHLLALIQMKNQEWNKARRTLRKAARIDKTNTTTLRFLREVDEQTGVTTKMENRRKSLLKSNAKESDNISGEITVRPSTYKERSKISLFFTVMVGFAAGAAAFWLLVLPAVKQEVYRQANEQIVQYSESLSSQGVALSKAQGEAEQSSDTADAQAKQIEEEKKRSQSYEALFAAYTAMQQEDLDTAAVQLQNVYVDTLSDSAKGIYNTISERTGVTGITDSSSDSTAAQSASSGADSSSDGTDQTASEDSGDGYTEE
ncbi:hypothetical protein WMO28_07040 [Blautia sp. CLA-JM-H16]|uniref:Tetratricopeptide repeat protein n=1 Tax=Blautia aquisgranensis TaxID=3133153 RepID=A0ABV1BG65_9FIRM